MTGMTLSFVLRAREIGRENVVRFLDARVHSLLWYEPSSYVRGEMKILLSTEAMKPSISESTTQSLTHGQV